MAVCSNGRCLTAQGAYNKGFVVLHRSQFIFKQGLSSDNALDFERLEQRTLNRVVDIMSTSLRSQASDRESYTRPSTRKIRNSRPDSVSPQYRITSWAVTHPSTVSTGLVSPGPRRTSDLPTAWSGTDTVTTASSTVSPTMRTSGPKH